MFDWEDLRVFAAVARMGSLAAAARSLKINHATVGRRVSALESALAVRLVDRLPRSTPLTQDGVAIAALAQDMERAAYAVLRVARGSSATLSGSVTVSAPPVIASEVIAPSLAQLRKVHPRLGMTLAATRSIASLDQGEADLAVRLVRPEQPAYVLKRLGTVQFGLYASPTIAITREADWSFISHEESLDHLPQERWLQEYVAGRPILFRSDTYGQVAAARGSVGVALLPCFLGDKDPELVRVDASSAPQARTLWLAIHENVRKAPAARAAADHLIALFASDSRFNHCAGAPTH